MTLFLSAFYSSAISTRSSMLSMPKRRGTSSTCFSTKQAGVQTKKIVTIQRAASMRIIRGTSAGHLTYSNMRLRTARLSRTVLVGTTVSAVSSVISVILQLRGSTILTSTSGSSVIGVDATRWIFVRSIITLGRKVKPINSASSMLNLAKDLNFQTSTTCTRSYSESMLKSNKSRYNLSSPSSNSRRRSCQFLSILTTTALVMSLTAAVPTIAEVLLAQAHLRATRNSINLFSKDNNNSSRSNNL